LIYGVLNIRAIKNVVSFWGHPVVVGILYHSFAALLLYHRASAQQCWRADARYWYSNFVRPSVPHTVRPSCSSIVSKRLNVSS